MYESIRSKIKNIRRLISEKPELNEAPIKWHIVNDPIHKTMSFTTQEKNLIQPFLDNPSFQRLRGIKQMGLAELVFPGAVHSRFSHSLGACHLASFIVNITESEKVLSTKSKSFILAALLHDIGHGPYSHTFEKLYIKGGKKILTHEDWSEKFIDDLFLTNYKLLNDYKSLNKLSISKAKSELKKIHDEIKIIFNDKSINKDFYSSLISSQLDVDRMDYLLRDSYFCGVEYGNYDIDWLLHSLRKCKDDCSKDRLSITPKGIGVVESFLLSRYLMRKHICLNKKVQSAEYLIMEFMSEIFKNKKARSLLRNQIKNNTFLNFINTLENQMSKNALKFDNSLNKNEIIDTCFETYKYIVDADVYMLLRLIDDMKPSPIILNLKEIAERILNRKLPCAFILRSEKEFIFTKVVNDFMTNNVDIKKWQIALHKPSVPECYESKEYPILVSADNHPSKEILQYFELDENGLIVSDLEKSSKIISRVSNLDDGICFLFIDKEISESSRVKKLIDKLRYLGCATYFR